MKKILLVLCTVLWLGLPCMVSAKESEVCLYCTRLEQKGFPPSYRERLCALLCRHPQWEFEPLLITVLSRKEGKNYDFDTVLQEELSVARRNLVATLPTLTPYATGEEEYDSGYRAVSEQALRYLMDPRNFLGEEEIFLFWRIDGDCALDGSSLLQGMAAQDCVESLVRVGAETGLSPLFLALRLRSEQGREGSPLLWGTAGDTLVRWWRSTVREEGGKLVLTPPTGYSEKQLLTLNGVYNPFHVKAAGSGRFAIYYNGACYAAERGWTSLEKGLLGGAMHLAEQYVSRYQNTLYLQKYNVDVRSRSETGGSRNFWGQYMQNVVAPVSESRALASCLRQTPLWEEKMEFLIPVYENMPPLPAPDPAEGACPLLSATSFDGTAHCLVPMSDAPTETQTPADSADALSAEGSREKRGLRERSIFFFCLVILGFCLSATLLSLLRRLHALLGEKSY